MPSPPFDATIVITTRNRKDELRRAVQSAMEQRGAAIEVLVIDDGSTDGTAEMIRTEFATVRLDRVEQSLGLIVQRNRGARLALAPIIVSIDDDAVFSTMNVVAQTLKDFDDPRIGAVAIPFINVRYDTDVWQRAPDNRDVYVTESYIGTAHALRKDVFLLSGGYREHFFHQCEEEDYCLRMLNRGFFVRLGRSEPIEHFESPQRSRRRVFVYNARNHLLFAWHNVPMPDYPIYSAGTTINLLGHGLRHRHLGWTLEGLCRGWAASVRRFSERAVVTRRIYRLSRWLKRRGHATLREAAGRLSDASRRRQS